jgi:hypothetical protein
MQPRLNAGSSFDSLKTKEARSNERASELSQTASTVAMSVKPGQEPV